MDNIFYQIISLENLFAAWREFRRGKRGRCDVQEFERCLEDNIFCLHDDLVGGNYHHGSYHRFHIFDPKHRIIHKASVRDRLLHHAVYRILYPIFDKSFIYDSYSCRIGKGTHAAVNRLEQFVRKASRNYTKKCIAPKFDIKKFFDSVDHGILMDVLEKKIDCQKTIDLLNEIVGGFSKPNTVVGGGSLFETKRPTGLPIGNLTSQLFANVYMNAFDHFIKEELHACFYLRYTDDAVIVHEDRTYLESLMPAVCSWLWEQRRLELHPNKIIISKLSQGIDFLGYVTLPHHRVLRTKTKKRMLARVNQNNLNSYFGLLKHCSARSMVYEILKRYT